MFSFFKTQSHGVLYWWLLILAGICFEGVALFYQYVLEYGPCPLCIHTRILVMAFVLIGVLALILRSRWATRLFHLVNVAVMLALSERAYVLLGTERGFVLSECGVDSGLPSWFALDDWFPFMFGVMESCGYTPQMLFGISMAESLIVVFPLMLLISLLMLVGSLIPMSED
jgi:protein dithiol:quinone oxidoreductase